MLKRPVEHPPAAFFWWREVSMGKKQGFVQKLNTHEPTDGPGRYFTIAG